MKTVPPTQSSFFWATLSLFSLLLTPVFAQNDSPSYLTNPQSLLIPLTQQKGTNNEAPPPNQPAPEPQKTDHPLLNLLEEELPFLKKEQDAKPPAKTTPPAEKPTEQQTPPAEKPTEQQPPLPKAPKQPEIEILSAPEDAEQTAPAPEKPAGPPLPSYTSPPTPPPEPAPKDRVDRAPKQLLLSPTPTEAKKTEENVPLFEQEPQHPEPGSGKFLFPEKEEPTPLSPEQTKYLKLEKGLQQRTEEKEEVITSGDVNFNNVSIIEYIRFLSKLSGKNFIFDEENLQFNISVVSEEPTTVKNLIAALLQELQVRGLSLIELGNTILIHPNSNIRAPGTLIINEDSTKQGDIITRVYRFNTLDPTKAADLIRPLLSSTAIINVLEDSNTLLVTDIATNIIKTTELLKGLDSPEGGVEVGQFVPEQSVAASLLNTAEQILQSVAQGNPFQLISHSPTNSIFVIGNPYLVERALALLKHLDSQARATSILDLERGYYGSPDQEEESPEDDLRQRLLQQGYRIGSSGELIPPGVPLSPQARMTSGLPTGHIARTMFFIYKLKYRNGDQILQALRQISGSLGQTGTTNEDLVSAINSIQWIEASNSLLFTGTAEALERIKELVHEIDVPLRQVFIEVLILNTTIRDSLTYNVEWGTRFGGGETAGAQAFLQADSLLPDALDTTGIGNTPAGDSLARQQGYRVGIVGRTLNKDGTTFQSIGALVTAIHTNSRQEIVMNPKIITEDNFTAELFVGSEQRLKTQSISNDEGSVLTNNFETVEIGTTLKITPHLGDNDIITLEIEQENTNALPDSNTGQSQAEQDVNLVPIASKSKTTTRVHVPDKYFLILSGMVSDDHQRVGNRVPCLGGIPILGGGFRDKIIQDTKMNLMIFIRPQIIDTHEDYRQVTERNQGIWDEKNKFRRSWNYEINEALDLFNLKRTDANERCSLYKEADCMTICPCPSN